jgi:hypothetical protein
MLFDSEHESEYGDPRQVHTDERGLTMIRVIMRDLGGDSGDGTLVGDFPPDQIASLLRLLDAIPGFRVGPDCDYVQVANDVQGGPAQWVVREERVVLEILTETAEPERGDEHPGWVFDPESFIGIRPA